MLVWIEIKDDAFRNLILIESNDDNMLWFDIFFTAVAPEATSNNFNIEVKIFVDD